MNKIRTCCNRGTSFIESEPKQSQMISPNTHHQSHISKEKQGLRIICSKGTAHLWIKKLPKLKAIQITKVIIQNRGTKRSECIL